MEENSILFSFIVYGFSTPGACIGGIYCTSYVENYSKVNDYSKFDYIWKAYELVNDNYQISPILLWKKIAYCFRSSYMGSQPQGDVIGAYTVLLMQRITAK